MAKSRLDPLGRESLMATCLLPLCSVHDWGWAQEAEDCHELGMHWEWYPEWAWDNSSTVA